MRVELREGVRGRPPVKYINRVNENWKEYGRQRD